MQNICAGILIPVRGSIHNICVLTLSHILGFSLVFLDRKFFKTKSVDQRHIWDFKKCIRLIYNLIQITKDLFPE